MRYSLETGLWQSVFAVPKDLVKKHIKLAGKEQLKTILWMLCYNDEPLSAAEIAAATGISTESAQDAIQYWLNCGFLTPAGDKGETTKISAELPAPALIQKKAEPALASPAATEPEKKKRLIKPDGHYVATRINESAEVRYLIQEAQTVLGKTISPALSSTLLAIHEDYGLPAEVIMMLIQYAKECGKTGTNYIEAVAKDWYDSNIFTLESAEQKLLELSEIRIAWKKFVGAVGIHDRPPSKKEEQFTHTWVYRFKMGQDMIAEAYERCVNATGKLSLSYMNKILDTWYNLGYKKLEDVQTSETQRREQAAAAKSYDIDKLEKDGFFKLVEDL